MPASRSSLSFAFFAVAPAIVVSSLALGACDSTPAAPPGGVVDTAGGDDASDVPVVEAAVTWHRDLRPVVELRCNGCHATGGIGPIPFDDLASVELMGPLMVSAATSGDMPPWPMDPDCRDVRDARVLSEAEKALFAAWKTEGYAMGDPADYVAPQVPAATAFGTTGLSLVRTPGYVPDTSISDDYRCFLFPQVMAEDGWIRGVKVEPDQLPLVHHVLVFMVPPEAAEELVVRDAETPDVPGYPCQGGSGAAADVMLSGWVPGSVGALFPESAAIEAPAGARFVMQMHYNSDNADRSRPIPADATGGWLELLPAGQDPSHVIAIRPVLDPVLEIQPNDAHAVEGRTFPVRWDGQLVGVAPHMHTRGTSIGVTLSHAAGGQSCVADIPAWDFHWQQTYLYEPDAYLDLNDGDELTIECVYDNSAANQPLVDGEPVAPALVKWGEGTADEMCLAYVVVMSPYDPSVAPEAPCGGFADCYEECPPGDAQCPVQCLIGGGTSCVQCGLASLFQTCSQRECPSQTAALAACLADCPGQRLQCAATTCKGQSDALYACLEPELRAGVCDGACGIEVAP